MEIGRIAKDIERFVRVLNCEFCHGGIGNDSVLDRLVQMRTVAGPLMRRQDQELSNSKT